MNSGKVCVSVCADNLSDMIDMARRSGSLADIVELRLDCLTPEELDRFALSAGRFILTLRPTEQGGNSRLSPDERKRFWTGIGVVAGADLEADVIDTGGDGKFDPLICSFHDFSAELADLSSSYDAISRSGAPVLKIAVTVTDATDAIAVWKLLDRARRDGRGMVPIAMGEAGKWTRILGLGHGAYLTYAAPDSSSETAPGQLSVSELVDIFRVKDLDRSTEVYGIIAGDTTYTMSPYVHNAAFKSSGRNAVFVPFQVSDLDQFIGRMVTPETREIDLNFHGFSVTNPHKQTVIRHLDEIDEAARKIGAVNTIKIVDGKLHGFNTDAIGFIEPLRSKLGRLAGARIAVVGAGGAARAAIYALKKAGADGTIFARNADKGRSLAAEFQSQFQQLETGNSKLETVLHSFDIIVNATPLGTRGLPQNETIAASEQLQRVKLVYDLIYNPAETRLLREAKAAGAETLGGFDMLIAQAVEQQKIWTGEQPDADAMSATARKKLDER
ncbi:MAG TPA: shikimate dehydrogenase [Pyrinomonadaceae bacterium]